MDQRSRIFQQLKPHCVNLSQAVLRVVARNGNPKDVIDALKNLLTTLQEGAAAYPQAIDDKLAEYVFFPLSHVLREKQKFPVVALELTLNCLAVLLQTGWRVKVDPALTRQFLILLPVLVSGQTIVTILEGVTDGASIDVQLSAAKALRSACNALKDREALASFLPGIVSALAKVLTPSTKQRRPYELLCLALEILNILFRAVLSDSFTNGLPSSDENSRASGQKLTQSWLKATAGQVKLALANVIRIRQHGRDEVRRALLDLCLVVLEDCRESLKDSAAMMTETMSVLCGSDDKGEMKSTVRNILAADSRFAELLRSSIHSWVVSLPRVMQSPDDSAKRRLIKQVSTGYELLAEQGVDLDIVDRAVASNLRDGLSAAVLDQTKLKEIAPAAGFSTALDLIHPTTGGPSMEFEPIFYDNNAQREIIHDLGNLVKCVSMSRSSMSAARELVDSLQLSAGAPQLASFWVALKLLKFSSENDALMVDFLDFGDSSVGPREELLEELYSFSLGLLQDSSTGPDPDWRLKALALEAIAFQAETLKEEFRIELVDALYPIVHLVGSPITELRSHAITCLNIIAAACNYKYVGSLIVENVDYLVNAVALKLNTFDISPQAPQVLLMMIKLSGPSLLPYLDDLVGSVFAALESFHGYPKLVELLFSVLKGIAEEGVKTPQLAIAQVKDASKAKIPHHLTSIDDVIAVLKDIQSRESKQESPEEIVELTPRRPWKDLKKDKNPLIHDVDEDEAENDNDDGEMDDEGSAPPPDPPPPAPKTYSLLLRISELTQHYLTSSSPTLRTSLLDLLNTTFPTLAKHENSFLPLVNTLWPVLVPRLDDSEAYVVSGALEILALMCRCAGDFMRSRVDAVWPTLINLYHTGGQKKQTFNSNTRKPAGGSSLLVQGGGGSGDGAGVTSGQVEPYYTSAPTRIIRGALVKLFKTIVETVQIDEKAFEEVLELLLPVVVEKDDLKEVFEMRNADAVWLALLRWEAKKSNGAGKKTTIERAGRKRPKAWKGRDFVSVGL
ncbi:HEAT repeat protein-like protein [Macrophomina phaseolina]|uniref:HEAT repeat protein-like protein n=1 Tax=Macrophomina phaseolina TaxID=35725 RepID=A0ABQ8GMV7_9PEZI|nr:HEAT repeat protein-like protein [Macrophomina phaseolina]